MLEAGKRNPDCAIDAIGLTTTGMVRYNFGPALLYEESIRRGEARLTAHGALVAETGQHTGRSPKDKFVVRDDRTEPHVWWDNNKAISPAQFEALLSDFRAHAATKDLYVQDLVGGADADLRLPVRVVTEFAWHSLFIRNLLIRPQPAELERFVPEMTIIDLPSFRADPTRHGTRTETVIAVDLTRKIVLIGGTSYAGEMKKSVFTMLNYLLPEKGVMPMHCSANEGPAGDAAVFFGLSGTGKTTLSADPSRTLIGDDEHGWGPHGIFNFEGGCYAKTIRLSAEAEPEIFATTQRFGTVLENVVLDAGRLPDFNDGSLTENTRCAYPLDYIPNASRSGRASHPKNIIMLTADAFGVMPPIARLTPAQAMYHFLSGYTAKVAGTEKGVTEPEATFSTCFGAPFMPRHPSEYGNLLRQLIAGHGVACWLVNTGWTGGAYGTGRRMPIKVTRALLGAALDGSLNAAAFRTDANFGFEVPVAVPGVDSAILDPRSTWADKPAYDRQAAKLVSMFAVNFEKFEQHVDAAIMGAAPRLQEAAE
ncbi:MULTISPECIES: phosphoenolpyruvate carboxykinase [unclassified Mesorhizobium]|uniref:phosphoenolpyruvate carboxykinase n=1 Tax=unclassified Mesorhizobium TaxID=325217 RepID=UPI000BB00C99|nr:MULTISPECIES: phosphoenolpyruvate carboxykinase [unclassified Mesorhizobium]TGT60582.1 phosphoenolpyruvate carboxykinase [Mesorhizobium sp. M00.F.Ca.ET.170.01.1.1]AZO10317.1 phosphoenolpyruvate carboxykinase [Mesorhizobium sp. M3A.F.Ca.ET.080.04.2.1]PBB87842.1 phosphoenolpyruvate carboxykinase (ATP) [Mesorhizobium sp. WSM3876]RWB73687.1 MAG: phosphoenolpyruvate carboxykinase [Mesorhizobium sp.]RWB91757.1 MAG: phosphoenolpyruvate carboxykinase [Mesorhizobium sp.]